MSLLHGREPSDNKDAREGSARLMESRAPPGSGDILEHVERMWHAAHMSKMIQVRDVPDRLHRELTKRAKSQGMTLTAYVQQLLEREVSRPPAEEVFERIARRDPVVIGQEMADLIREERASREAY